MRVGTNAAVSRVGLFVGDMPKGRVVRSQHPILRSSSKFRIADAAMENSVKKQGRRACGLGGTEKQISGDREQEINLRRKSAILTKCPPRCVMRSCIELTEGWLWMQEY